MSGSRVRCFPVVLNVGSDPAVLTRARTSVKPFRLPAKFLARVLFEKPSPLGHRDVRFCQVSLSPFNLTSDCSSIDLSMATNRSGEASYKRYEVDMTNATSQKEQTRKELKLDQDAHEAQAKADKLKRHALDNGKDKKAERAQDKADEKAAKVSPTQDGDE